MSDRGAGLAPSRLTAVLGPTNTGKTHLAVERMLGHASGMIGLPLRLLAREIYDRIVKLRGARSVALITGEEKIVPPRPVYFVCTVEAMPLNADVEFLAVDEIQLCADPERGHVFTNRLLHARGRFETMFLGSQTMAPLIRALLPEAQIVARERFSTLSYAGSKKVTRLPRRSAIVAFSADAVYAIAELIRRQRGGAAVVMGSLSPRTRNAQVALYQSGEVDFLVATDAIGMGLNMDVDHVAFAGLRKFDGKRTRWLHAPEIAQIAGRAGRHVRDGTFGVTGECVEMDEDLVLAVESHRFDPVVGAEWRNADLDFDSLKDLLRSLARAPQRPGLKLSAEALDELVLRKLAEEEEVARRVGDRGRLRRLWEVAQIPDFRKTSLDEHVRLAKGVFEHLTGPGGRLPDDWIAPQFAALDRTDGEIDALAGRLAAVRTLAYAANRPDWLRNAAEWMARTRALEDRLSDTLHEKLMQRFIDRRTSALMRSLRVPDELLAGVGEGGEVTVEGHFVGKLRGVRFEPAQGGSQLEDKALRAAAQRAVGPEVARRLGRLAADADAAFALHPDGTVTWRGEAAARVLPSRSLSPRVRLLAEMGPETAIERASRRIEAWLAAEARRRLAALVGIEEALAKGALRGLARGVAWRLAESGGLVDRREVDHDLKALSQQERRALRALGVKFGAFSVWAPGLQKPGARTMAAVIAPDGPADWRPPPGKVSLLPAPQPGPRALAARGLRACGRLAAPVDQLERLDEMLRTARQAGGRTVLSDQAREELGWSDEEAAQILKSLGFSRGKTSPVWKPRKATRPELAQPAKYSPFAALAALKPVEPRRARRPRRRKSRAGPGDAS
ncbi:MAG: phosphonate-binding protein [Caulobacteraceae bacterium]|nr:phosphonate-binding protein [Caulobacteraceae bacterium]